MYDIVYSSLSMQYDHLQSCRILLDLVLIERQDP